MINITTAIILSIIAIVSIGLVLIRYQTVLLGFTFYSFLYIASASLSGFWLRSLRGSEYAWVTEAHLWVFIYSALGLIAFSVGVFAAWRPLRVEGANFFVNTQSIPWLNARFAFLCLTIGSIAYFGVSYAYRVPTLQAVWSNYFNFLQFGMLIALIDFKEKHNYRSLFIALLIFLPMSLYQALLSGHIGAAGNFLLQLLLVANFWKGINVRSVLSGGIGFILILALMVGWLDSRDLIRKGTLNNLSMTGRSIAFMQQFDYVNPLSIDLNVIDYKIYERVDMTSILTAQVRYQPLYKPYAYGETIFSSLLAALVPRFIWPNKPISLGGSDFVSKYTGLFWSKGTSIGLAYQFEFYANGGIVGVIIGLFLIGLITAKLELATCTGKHSLPHFLGLLITTNSIAYGSQTIIAVVMSTVAGYIGVYILGKFLEKLNISWHFWQDTERPTEPEPYLARNRPSRYVVR